MPRKKNNNKKSRNLAYLGVVEILFVSDRRRCAHHGCDKTTPALLMAFGTSIFRPLGPLGRPSLDRYFDGKLAAPARSWEARRRHAAGEIDYETLQSRSYLHPPDAWHATDWRRRAR